jgi:signal-transduction protein with cAMP-binding, CBS, and nucleotidyltransferase domain
LKDLTVLQAKRYGIFNCQPNTPLIDAARTMVEEDISGLVVVDQDGYLEGIFTRTDLLRAVTTSGEWYNLSVGQFMTRQVITVMPHDHINDVVALLMDRQIHRVVIVLKENEKLRPVGVISDADLVYHLTREIKKDN